MTASRKFSVGINGRGIAPHVACFEDFAKALADALRQLGHQTVDFGPESRCILIGANNISGPTPPEAKDAIIYNSEQLASVDHPEHLMTNWKSFRDEGHWIWDYSKSNIAAINKLGIDQIVHCPLGYVPSMTSITPAPVEDIDVLFYGSLGKPGASRRRVVLDECKALGLNTVGLFGVYGAERDSYIARAKIVLNMHFYANPVFEIFRCSHLFANKKCVVSESGSQDLELENFAKSAACVVPIEDIAESCLRLVKDDAARRQQAEDGFGEFAKLSFVESVGRALEQTGGMW